jgi:hypothetical protein
MSIESHDGMILTGYDRRTRRKTCPSVILCTPNPTCTDPGLCAERPATNREDSHNSFIGKKSIAIFENQWFITMIPKNSPLDPIFNQINSVAHYACMLDTHSVRMIVNRARQLCSGAHKVQEQGVGQGTHGDELH